MENPVILSVPEAKMAAAHFQRRRDVPVWLINRVEYMLMPYTYSLYIGFALKALYKATGDKKLCEKLIDGINEQAVSHENRDAIVNWCRDTLGIELEMGDVIKKVDE